MAILLIGVYRFKTIPFKFPMMFFIEIEKAVMKFIWKYKRPKIAKAIFPKKSIAGCITIPDLKLHYRTIVTKTARNWHKNRHEDQWNRTEFRDTPIKIVILDKAP